MTLVQALAGFVAAEHVGFLVLESFFWQKPVGRKIFGTTAEFAKQSAPLAANQGLYNGFLAAGLFWGACPTTAPELSAALLPFFFGCVAVAGIVGALTVKPRIFFVQAAPALIGLVLTKFPG